MGYDWKSVFAFLLHEKLGVSLESPVCLGLGKRESTLVVCGGVCEACFGWGWHFDRHKTLLLNSLPP